MARIAVQFVANSNMGAVSKDIAKINAQLATMAHEMAAVGAANPAGIKSMGDTFRKDIANIKGYETATMSARTVTAQLTDEINRQKIQMKDLGKVRQNLGEIAQEQMRLMNSSAMITGRDINGRVMGELVTPTDRYARSAKLAAVETGILGRAMESAGQQTLAAGKRMQWTGRQLSAGLTAPIVAFGAVSAKAAYDIDAAMVRLTKVYGDLGGATEQQLDDVRSATMETAKAVAQSYGISGKATVELAADLAAAGYEGERLQETVREVQRISLLGELDQQKAMDATRTIQTVFGISTEDLASKFDFLNAVENQTNTTLQDLTEVIPRTANVVRELGGSLEDSAIFTVAFKEAGIDAVQGANALRSSLGAIVAPSDVAAKKLMDLGIDIRQIAAENHPDNGGGGIVAMLQALGAELDQLGGLARQEALAKLFGRYQFNKMDGLLKGLAETAGDTGTQVGRAFALAGASSEELAEVARREIEQIQQSLSGRLRAAGATIVVTMAEIGKPILNLAVVLAEVFAGFLGIIDSLPGPIKGTIGLMLGILALTGPFLFFKGIFMALYGSTIQWLGGMKATRAGVGELETANSRFASLAASTVIPAINAETGAIGKLSAAFGVAATQMQRLTVEQQKAAAGVAAGTTAGVQSTRMVQPRGDDGRIVPGPKRPMNTMATSVTAVGTPGMILATAQVADNTEKASKFAERMRGQWVGVASSVLLVGPLLAQMVGASGGVANGIMLASLGLGLFPGILTRIAGLVSKIAKAKAFEGLAGKAGGLSGRLKGVAGGATLASAALTFLKRAVTALMGPLGIIVAGITLAIGAWKLWKKGIEDARKEQEAINGTAKSLSQIVGFEYKSAAQMATQASEEQTESLHDQARAWLETSEAAKVAAEAIKEAGAEQQRSIAMDIFADARANGASMEDAGRTAMVALAAGGFTERDAKNLVEGFMGQVGSVAEAEAYQFEKIGESYVKSLNSGAKKTARAEQDLKDYGKRFAAQLTPDDPQQIIAKMDQIEAEIREKNIQMLSNIEMDGKSREFLIEFGIDPDKEAEVTDFFTKKYPNLTAKAIQDANTAIGAGNLIPSSILDMADAADEAAEKEKILVQGIKEAIGATGAQYDSVVTLNGVRRAQVGNTISLAKAEEYYKSAVQDAEQENRNMGRSTVELSDAERLALLNTARLAAGLEEAAHWSQGFRKQTINLTESLEESKYAFIAATDNAEQFTNALKGRIGGIGSDAIDLLMEDFDMITEAEKAATDAGQDAWEDAYDARVDAAEDAFDAQADLLDEHWDREKKVLDERHDREIKVAEDQKDARIKAIEDEMDAADALDDQRKKMFEAEITRMQRLSAAANRNIDFNIALKTGNLDEAARIQESAYTESITNAVSDATGNIDVNAEARRAAGESRINAVTTEEDARIERLKSVQEVEQSTFEKSRDMAKKALETAKEQSRERFETEKQNYERTAKAAEDAYDRARKAKRKQVEESLQQLAIEVPKTQEEYNRMFIGLDAKYTEQTGRAATKTREWTDMHRSGFRKAMDDTLLEMGNSAAWSDLGKKTMNDMTQGMLGMSFDDYITWVETGVKPQTHSTPSTSTGRTSGGGTRVAGQGGSVGGVTMHSGGPVNGMGSGRAGRPLDAPLYSDEVPAVLQKGEYVLDKQTVSNLGVNNVKAMHAAKGQTSFFHEGGMVGAIGAGIMGTFRDAMTIAVQKQAANKANELAMAGQYEDIPEALRYVAQAAKGGKYGGSNLTDEQLRNAATIIGVGKSMGATEKDLVVAIMTALQESTLRNINYGDRDSVGLFQQRTSQGWGTIEQIMDPNYSSRKFFEALFKLKGREDMGLSQTAQAVQRSAFPSAYAKWEDEATAILAAMKQGGMGGQYNGAGVFRAYGGSVSGDIQGLNMDFLNRLARWSAAVGQTYNVGSGYRSLEEQARLYAAYRAGVPGQAPAAAPGRSNHNFGLASDGPRWGGRNPGAFGLTYPMSYEPWHVEPIGAKGMRIPQLEVGGSVNYDNTIANLHKNETVLTAPLSKRLQEGINSLDSGSSNHYTIKIDGTGLDADAIANKVMSKIERKEQVRGPRRVIT